MEKNVKSKYEGREVNLVGEEMPGWLQTSWEIMEGVKLTSLSCLLSAGAKKPMPTHMALMLGSSDKV